MHARLKQTPGIYLVGFMGCGKSTVGQILAAKLEWSFVDLDKEIEKKAGSSIPAIFDTVGEPGFRTLERQALAEQVLLVRKTQPRVIALGGGAFEDPRNRNRVASAGISIWLDCPVDELWKRVADQNQEDQRPLARDPSRFTALYERRRSCYQEADFTIVDQGKGPEALVADILKLLLV